MAVETTKIWVQIVKLDEKRKRWPIRLEVNRDAVIYDVVETGLVKVKLNNIAPDLVTVKFEDAEVRRGAQVSNYANTTDSNPLLLQIDEGM